MLFDPNQEVDLSRFEPAFRAAKAETKTPLSSVPDGIYHVALEDLALGASQTSGNPSLKWVLRIQGPTQKGRLLYKWNGISERSIPYLVDELERCGVMLARISELEQHLPNMIGLELEVAKKTKGERSNVYINKLLSAPPRYVVADDGLPF
jgi:hypothetical protein